MEGLGIVLLQASAAGVPVVASAVGGIGEAIAHEENGLLVEPGDPSALAAGMNRLLAEESLARRMGEEGRRRVADLFSVDRMVQGNLEVYQEVLGR
jgi:glycosyltransferase involved in cell wall biosynthesis